MTGAALAPGTNSFGTALYPVVNQSGTKLWARTVGSHQQRTPGRDRRHGLSPASGDNLSGRLPYIHLSGLWEVSQ